VSNLAERTRPIARVRRGQSAALATRTTTHSYRGRDGPPARSIPLFADQD